MTTRCRVLINIGALSAAVSLGSLATVVLRPSVPIREKLAPKTEAPTPAAVPPVAQADPKPAISPEPPKVAVNSPTPQPPAEPKPAPKAELARPVAAPLVDQPDARLALRTA